MSLFFLDQKSSIAQVDCLSINTGPSNLLVPMPAIAEIILNQELIADEEKPQWMFGWIKWRNLTIPLIDFAALQQTKPCADFGSSTRIVVLNSLVEGHEHRYYAIICKGFPHTIRVEEDSALSAQDEVEIATCISLSFDLDGQHLDLPDFEEIETHLRTIPHSH
jgi:chemosensory pili system protein ChpC